MAIIVSVLALVGVIIPALFTNGAIQLSQPLLQFELTTSPGSNAALVDITNAGNAAATNTSVFVVAPREVRNATVSLATVEVTSLTMNGTFVEVKVPRFAQGAGSVLRLQIQTNENTTLVNSKFSAYAVYDQGSSSNADILSSLSKPMVLVPIYVLVYGYAIGFWFYFRAINRRTLIRRMLKDLLDIRHNLKEDIEFSGILHANVNSRANDARRRALSNIPDVLLISDIYAQIEERNAILAGSNPDMIRVMVLNHFILRDIEKAFRVIDWSNYQKFWPSRGRAGSQGQGEILAESTKKTGKE